MSVPIFSKVLYNVLVFEDYERDRPAELKLMYRDRQKRAEQLLFEEPMPEVLHPADKKKR